MTLEESYKEVRLVDQEEYRLVEYTYGKDTPVRPRVPEGWAPIYGESNAVDGVVTVKQAYVKLGEME